MIWRAARIGVFALVALAFVRPAWAETRIFVASSLVDFAQSAAAAAQLDVKIVAGGSSTLARQIEAGAHADLFISANEDWAEHAAGERDLLPLFGNSLVLVADRAGPIEIEALPLLLGEHRLALADPHHVPAGLYAKAAFEYLGLWEALSAHVAAAENVRSAARFVRSGAAPFGVVYGSDAKAMGLPIAFVFPAESHPPIRYWAVPLSDDDPAVDAFLAFIDSAEGHKLLAEFGFQPIEHPL
jgi:molybdate transport system substrate-binding protein